MASYTIRQARIEDCDVIHELLKEFAVHEHYQSSQISNTIEGLKRDGFGEHAWFQCLVSECVSNNQLSSSGNEVVGFLVFYYGYDAWEGKLAYISDLFISEKHRGCGLGKKMMQQAARISTRVGCVKMQWIVSDWNVAARNFYKHIGAVDHTDHEKEVHRQHYIVLGGNNFQSFANAAASIKSNEEITCTDTSKASRESRDSNVTVEEELMVQ